MDFDEIIGRLKIFGAVFLVAGGFFWWQISSAKKAALEESSAGREEVLPVGGVAGAKHPRVTQAREAGYAGRLDEALAQAREIVSSPVDPEEGEAGLQVLGGLLMDSMRKAATAGDLDAGERIWKEIVGLKATGPKDSASWELRSWARREIDAGGLERARRLAGLVLAAPLRRDDIRGYELLRAFRKLLLARRADALTAGRKDEAEALFLEAASLDPWGDELQQALAGTPVGELVAVGKRLLKERRFSASLAHCNAAWESRDLTEADRAAVSVYRDECWLGLTAEAESAGLIGSDSFISALSFLERVSGPHRSEASSRMPVLLEKAADAAAKEGNLLQAESYLRSAMEKAEGAWRSRAFSEPPDLWTGIDPAVAAELRLAHAAGVERSNALSAKVMDSRGLESPVLECRRLALKLEDLAFERALDETEKDHDEGLRMLRPFLRQRTDAMSRARADAAVRGTIKLAMAKKDLSRLTDRSAFLISELGAPQPGDPFHSEFLSGLQAASKEFETSAPNKGIFILSLIADAFPSEPAGKSARQEAVTRGLAFFKTASESPPAGRRLAPSLLPGQSVISVENATEHHILLFYEGPDRFFLRLNPFRRGSAVLPDGTYSLGVMASDDEIVPYRSTKAYAGEQVLHRFVIERHVGGRKEGAGFRIPTSGDWALLRLPAGVSGLAVDPKSGRVARAP
ncbi:MAG: hypothetical protein WC943_11205 [Elusimicrobiota bacterium]|jgi:hypothetical protein